MVSWCLGCNSTTNCLSTSRVYHEDRPFWYVRETHGHELQQHRLTCETTSGYPSKHVMTITGFLVIAGYFAGKEMCQMLNDVESKALKVFISAVQLVFVFLMAFCRMYFSCHFMHQCLGGAILAMAVLYGIRCNHCHIFTIGKIVFVGGVVALATFVIVTYYAMLVFGYDPHWPVRMAFKWCSNPDYLKHESISIFQLSRDFGSILGVALSAPLIRL